MTSSLLHAGGLGAGDGLLELAAMAAGASS